MMWKVHSWLFNFMCSIDSAVQFWSNQCIVVPDTPGPGCSGPAHQEFCLLLSGGSLSSFGEGYRGACWILLRPTVYIDIQKSEASCLQPIGECSQRRIILGSAKIKRSRFVKSRTRIMGGLLLTIVTWLRKTKKSKTRKSLASKSSSSSIASQSSSKMSSMSTSASGSNSTLESLLKMLPVHTLEYTNFKIYDEGVWSSSETEDDGLYKIIDFGPFWHLPQLPGVLVWYLSTESYWTLS